MIPDPLPHPQQLFRLLEAGSISREAFQAAMRQHQLALIEAMEEAHRNPIAAAFEEARRRFAAAKLTRHHNEEEIREVFSVLSELPDFPPALYLWNAAHRHVPLSCFFRPSEEPVFRVIEFNSRRLKCRILVEHGAAPKRKATREEILLERNPDGRLQVHQRLRR